MDIRTLTLMAALAGLSSPALAAGNPENGEALYEARCGACHSLDANRVGPRHRGLIGRRAGSLDDYGYSAALKRARFRWDAAMLDRWLADPETVAPGQKMGYRVADATDRADLVAYLVRESAR